ncbi:MAG: serine/threonine protein kinase, partial [bacterium]|nr:serine/threonine protein kinase [bacterium]
SLLVERIEHPHIVKVYERGEDAGKLYIVMELLEGESLGERINNKRYPGTAQSIHIMVQVADVLAHLGRENIIHRDLKPDNIMLVCRDGDPDYVKLLDFGIARSQTFSHLTESGHILGTLPYMPAEVISGGKFSPAVDVYSLGVIGYMMLTRMQPFRGDIPIETMKQIAHRDPIEPIKLAPEIPVQLNDLILKMLDKDPELRPSAAEVREQLLVLRAQGKEKLDKSGLTPKILPNSRSSWSPPTQTER